MIIKSAEYVKGATKVSQFPTEKKPEFVFCGRSNVGKSSFINMLCNRKSLAKTSSKPGKTQVLNIFDINKSLYFVDVPGYGYAEVSKEVLKSFAVMIEGYFRDSENLKCAFLLVDSRHDPTKDDCNMYNYFKYYGIPCCVVATKCDQISVNKFQASIKAIRNKLQMDESDKVVLTSAMKKKGIDEILDIIEGYLL
ncbi:MAG: ribosome biogenesis GTP-binding protein YihA/YsxC [Anaeroplasmataceae bacterium]